MKRMLMIAIILLFVFSLVTPGYCDDPIKKLGRGICNVALFWLEVPEQMGRVNETDGPFAGWTYGLLKGTAMMFVRAAAGVYETVTFPIPVPADYKPMLTDPEFFLEHTTY